MYGTFKVAAANPVQLPIPERSLVTGLKLLFFIVEIFCFVIKAHLSVKKGCQI